QRCESVLCHQRFSDLLASARRRTGVRADQPSRFLDSASLPDPAAGVVRPDRDWRSFFVGPYFVGPYLGQSVGLVEFRPFFRNYLPPEWISRDGVAIGRWPSKNISISYGLGRWFFWGRHEPDGSPCSWRSRLRHGECGICIGIGSTTGFRDCCSVAARTCVSMRCCWAAWRP